MNWTKQTDRCWTESDYDEARSIVRRAITNKFSGLRANHDAWQYYFLKFKDCEEGWGTGKIKPEFEHLFDEKGNLI